MDIVNIVMDIVNIVMDIVNIVMDIVKIIFIFLSPLLTIVLLTTLGVIFIGGLFLMPIILMVMENKVIREEKERMRSNQKNNFKNYDNI